MFVSHYRHRPSYFGQQNKGYAVRGFPVNRHGMYYGMFYGPSVLDIQPISETVPEPIWGAGRPRGNACVSAAYGLTPAPLEYSWLGWQGTLPQGSRRTVRRSPSTATGILAVEVRWAGRVPPGVSPLSYTAQRTERVLGFVNLVQRYDARSSIRL